MHTVRLYIQLLIVLLGIAVEGYTQTNHYCNVLSTGSSCNQIPNPRFNLLRPGTLLYSGFFWGNVLEWGAAGCNTPDVNAVISGSATPNPLPAAIGTANFASMAVQNTHPSFPNATYTEGIAAKIKPVKKGGTYAFSFYAVHNRQDSFAVGASYTFKIVLIKCFNIGPYPWDCPTNQPSPIPNIAEKQVIFCAPYENMNERDWKRYVFTFEAEEAYNMVLIYPEEVDNKPPLAGSWVHFAYPELVNIDPVVDGPSNSCNTNFKVCGVSGTQYTWIDNNGRVISNTETASSNTSKGGTWTVKMVVPADQAPNTCSNNSNSISRDMTLAPCTPCNTSFSRGTVTYHYQGQNITKDLLPDCNRNAICHGVDEGVMTLDLLSNYASGNTWELFREGVNATDPAANIRFQGNYPTNQQHYNPRFIFIDYRTPTRFEIRLTNSVVNKTESIFFTLYPPAGLEYVSCWTPNRPDWITYYFGTVNTTANTTYAWDFSNPPAGFQVEHPDPFSPNINYYMPPGVQSYDGIVTIINSAFGCDVQKRVTLWNAPNNCMRMASGKPDEQAITPTTIHPPVTPGTTILYPNPVTSSFTVKSDKRIRGLALYGVEGKLLKRFFTPDIHRPMEIDDLSAGVYWVLITYADNSTETKRIVKPNNKR